MNFSFSIFNSPFSIHLMEIALYLLPVTLGDTPWEKVLPGYNKEIIVGIRHFIVEDVRSARRFLKKVDKDIDIDALTFYPLNKHTSPADISGYLKPLEGGLSMGVISEAGCPAVADPGADVVAIAQRKGLKVVPLVGPSSIILSVMGSGFNGQSFAFKSNSNSVSTPSIRHNCSLKHLIVTIRCWTIFFRIAVLKRNFALQPTLHAKESSSKHGA